MKNKIIWLIIILALIFAGVYASKNKDSGEESGETVKIGFIGPFSGTSALMGEEQKTAFDIAMKEINGQEGKESLFSVVYEDGKCEGLSAATAAQKLISIDKVKALISVCSAETLSVAPIAQQNKVPLLAVWPTNPKVSEAGEYVFRNSYSDADSAKVIANLLIDNKYSEILVLTEETSYGVGFSDAFRKNFTGKIYEEKYQADAKDVRTQLTKLLAHGRTLPIFLIPNTPVTGLQALKQLKELGFTGPIFGDFFGDSPMILERPEAQGMIFASDPQVPDNQIKQNLWKKFQAVRNSEPEFSFAVAATYDVAYMIREALRSNARSSEDIKNYLSQLKDFNGALGRYGFDQNGDAIGLLPAVKQIKDKRAVNYMAQ